MQLASDGTVWFGFCVWSDDDHMEEEVQLKVQEEEEVGESHGKEQGEEQTVKERTVKERTTLRRA